MSKRESIARYSLIIQKLRRRPASFEEIKSFLEIESEIQGFDFSLGIRTFQRDLNEIRSLYNIDIKCDKSTKLYYINNEEQDTGNERLLEAFDIINALKINEKLSNFIQFEDRRPQGTEHLFGLLHAVKNRLQIKFVYSKYWEEEQSNRVVEPYMLKEFKHRWYILAKDLKNNELKCFALDRISDLEISHRKFLVPDDFNADKFYENYFGIISPKDEKPEEIILSFDPFQGKYIKSLPLHTSQEILIDNESELRVKLRICITHDFVMELLSHGDSVRVIGPEKLIKELKEIYNNVLNFY
jgi:predicted DNA-binding transcriptional regulator YafY